MSAHAVNYSRLDFIISSAYLRAMRVGKYRQLRSYTYVDTYVRMIYDVTILYFIYIYTQYVLLKALPPVCMKCIAGGESRVASMI